MQRAELIAVRVAHISQIKPHRAAFAPAGRVFNAGAAIGDRRIMEGLHLFWAVASEANRAAIGTAGGLAINRLADAKRAGWCAVKAAPLRVHLPFRDPKHAHAYNALGYSLADRNQRLDEARTLIERAIELGGHEPFLIDSLGWVAYREGHLDDAERLLRQAWRGRPDAEIVAHLAEVLWHRGQRDEAQALLTQAAQREPKHPALQALRKKLGLR